MTTASFIRAMTSVTPLVHPKAVLRTESGSITLTLPWAPRNIEHSGYERVWTEVARKGDEPLLIESGSNLRTMSFDFIIATKDRQVSVESTLNTFTALAASTLRVYFAYGPTEGGLWRITNATVSSINRQQGTNNITQANLHVEMKRNITNVVGLGPVTSTVPKKPPVVAKKPAAKKPAARYYVVRRGDTLSAISLRYYHTASKWPLLASVNKIKNANLIYPGRRLLIP